MTQAFFHDRNCWFRHMRLDEETGQRLTRTAFPRHCFLKHDGLFHVLSMPASVLQRDQHLVSASQKRPLNYIVQFCYSNSNGIQA